MQITLTGRRLEVTDALRQYATEKLQRLGRHNHMISHIEVIFDVEKVRHIVKANVTVKGAQFHAEAEQEDMYAAIDSLVDKLDRQLKAHKEKITDHHDG